MLCEPNSLYVEKNKEGWIVLRILSWKYEGLRQERKVVKPSSLGLEPRDPRVVVTGNRTVSYTHLTLPTIA